MITVEYERFLGRITRTDKYILIEGDLEDTELVVKECNIDIINYENSHRNGNMAEGSTH